MALYVHFFLNECVREQIKEVNIFGIKMCTRKAEKAPSFHKRVSDLQVV